MDSGSGTPFDGLRHSPRSAGTIKFKHIWSITGLHCCRNYFSGARPPPLTALVACCRLQRAQARINRRNAQGAEPLGSTYGQWNRRVRLFQQHPICTCWRVGQRGMRRAASSIAFASKLAVLIFGLRHLEGCTLRNVVLRTHLWSFCTQLSVVRCFPVFRCLGWFPGIAKPDPWAPAKLLAVKGATVVLLCDRSRWRSSGLRFRAGGCSVGAPAEQVSALTDTTPRSGFAQPCAGVAEETATMTITTSTIGAHHLSLGQL